MAGGDHAFAVHENGLVYTLVLDHVAQTPAIEQEREDSVNIFQPCPVENLKGRAKVVCIGGGNYHSFAVTDKGGCIKLGQYDTHVSGHKVRQYASGELVR